MSLMSATSVALSGIQVATSQMQLVASNISNAQTAGYSRQSAILEAVVLGDDAGGTRLTGYQRATSAGTQSALRQATSEVGYYSTQDGYMANVESIFGTNLSSPALSNELTAFCTAWRELAASPESTTQQAQVIAAGVDFTEQVQTIASEIEALNRQVRDDIDSTLSDVNDTLKLIEQYNDDIAAAKGAGQPTGSMEDERDQLVLKISKVVEVTVYDRGAGRIALYTPQGYQLLDKTANSFAYDGTNVYSEANPSLSLNNVLTNGSLQAAVDFRYDGSPAAASTDAGTEVIRKLRDQLDAICEAFTDASAGTFANAYNPTATVGEDFFVGTDRMTFSVNASLIDGTLSIDTDNATDVVEALNDETRTFTADGLTATGSYEKLGTSIISRVQQNGASVAAKLTPAESQRSYLETKLANETGVNVDTELVSLTTLENAYNASAKVINVINKLYDILETIV